MPCSYPNNSNVLEDPASSIHLEDQPSHRKRSLSTKVHCTMSVPYYLQVFDIFGGVGSFLICSEIWLLAMWVWRWCDTVTTSSEHLYIF
jgi:hypothetical protein